MSRLLSLVAVFLLSSLGTVGAHEVRPALLELTEVAEMTFDVTWKQPLLDGKRLRLEPRLPDACEVTRPQRHSNTYSFLLIKWQVHCDAASLEGQPVSISGLDQTLTDVFLRVRRVDGSMVNLVLRPDAPTWTFSEKAQSGIAEYIVIGIEHILLGWDHLLFVFMLLILVRDPVTLLKTVTAFTIAHSITLGLSAVGGLSLPQGPVEALIALSIVVLAAEAAKPREGSSSLVATAPWVAAIAFGLLHGLGFAGALSEIGLPDGARLWALLLFNVGVEIGQIIFIAVCVAIWWALTMLLQQTWPERAKLAAIYAGGGIAAYWFLERTGGILFA